MQRPGNDLNLDSALPGQAFADKLVEVVAMDDDYVWIHDYHLLVRACPGPARCPGRAACALAPVSMHASSTSCVVHRPMVRSARLLGGLTPWRSAGLHALGHARSCVCRFKPPGRLEQH